MAAVYENKAMYYWSSKAIYRIYWGELICAQVLDIGTSCSDLMKLELVEARFESRWKFKHHICWFEESENMKYVVGNQL